MAKETNLTKGISEPEKVDLYMKGLDYPLKDVVEYLRALFLSADIRIGEGIYWNVPTFYFTGPMNPFEPKAYKRYLVGFNFFQKDCIRLIFLHGASVKGHSELLQGDYKDGRRIASIRSIEDALNKEKELQAILQQLILLMDQE